MVTFASEGALVARLRKGDQAAYRELVTRHNPALLALARTILRNAASAEEVVQETWLAVVMHVGRFEERCRLSTWIMEILLNKARSRATREGRWVNFSDLAREAGEAVGDDAPERFMPSGHWAEPVASWDLLDPERIVAGRDLWSHMAKAIEALPPVQRAVVVMRDVDDAAVDDIGRLLGLSPAHVRVLLHRGRSRLRRVIDALVNSPPHAVVTSVRTTKRNVRAPDQSNPTQGRPAERALPWRWRMA